MKIERTLNSQNNSQKEKLLKKKKKKEKKEKLLNKSSFLASNYTTKLQQSKQYGTGIKTEIWINGMGQKAQK